MDAFPLDAAERSTSVDTALLLTQAMSDASLFDTGTDSISGTSSPSSTHSSDRKTLTDASTTTSIDARALEKRRVRVWEEVQLPYTIVESPQPTQPSEWNLAHGFPFPCPVVRDPTKRGAVYVPGEVLRNYFNRSSTSAVPTLTREITPPMDNGSRGETEPFGGKMELEEASISLREVIRQVPIRLSHLRNGATETNFYDAWLYGDPQEPLRDRFARMERGLRSKFIGLKNSSARVRDKVRRKRMTTYKEVAEELVDEIGLADVPDRKSALEAENLKRRVYDVLNVFEAVGLIAKDHKNVYWKGCAEPRDREIHNLETRLEFLKTRLQKRKRYLDYITESYSVLNALSERNRELPYDPDDPTVDLPCLLIHAPESVPVDIKFVSGSRKVHLDFHGEDFSISGDMWALRQMGLYRQDETPSTPFFQKLFASELSNVPLPPRQLPPGHFPGLTAPLHGSSKHLGEKLNPFVPLTLENGFESPGVMDSLLSAADASRLIDVGPPRKRSRTSSIGEYEDTDSPLPIHS